MSRLRPFLPHGILGAVALALSPCGLPRAHAEGSPPMITDDPGTPGDGHWEINALWNTEHRPGTTIQELPLLDLNYGVGERLQIKYEAAWVLLRENGLPGQSDLGNSNFGIKWRFADQEKSGLDLSTYPQFEFRNPGTSAVRKGIASDENSLKLPVEFQWESGGVCVVGEVGRIVPSKSDDEWVYGFSVAHPCSPRLAVALELHGFCSPTAARSELTADVGAHYSFSEKSALLFSVGRELHNHFDARATLLLTVGWQWRL